MWCQQGCGAVGGEGAAAAGQRQVADALLEQPARDQRAQGTCRGTHGHGLNA